MTELAFPCRKTARLHWNTDGFSFLPRPANRAQFAVQAGYEQSDPSRAYNDAQARLTALASHSSPKAGNPLACRKTPPDKSPRAVRRTRVPARGKSDAQIAAMLQSTLTKKNCMLANQTLISFQLKKLKQEGHASPDDQN
jgi:hypothetical protein